MIEGARGSYAVWNIENGKSALKVRHLLTFDKGGTVRSLYSIVLRYLRAIRKSFLYRFATEDKIYPGDRH